MATFSTPSTLSQNEPLWASLLQGGWPSANEPVKRKARLLVISDEFPHHGNGFTVVRPAAKLVREGLITSRSRRPEVIHGLR